MAIGGNKHTHAEHIARSGNSEVETISERLTKAGICCAVTNSVQPWQARLAVRSALVGPVAGSLCAWFSEIKRVQEFGTVFLLRKIYLRTRPEFAVVTGCFLPKSLA